MDEKIKHPIMILKKLLLEKEREKERSLVDWINQ